jgi:hypothetical protein
MYPDYRSCVETTTVQYLYYVICNIILLTDTTNMLILYLPLTLIIVLPQQLLKLLMVSIVEV